MECHSWNSLEEQTGAQEMPHHKGKKSTQSRALHYAGTTSQVLNLADVQDEKMHRLPTGLREFDRALGGGLVAGSVVLIGGDPGIGKSTILLQTACHMAREDTPSKSALYVTGEESLSQVAMRARRLGLPTNRLKVLAQTHVDSICLALSQEKPAVCVIDSIQTLYSDSISSAPGGVSQIKETAAILTRFAKTTGLSLFLVGHVTKEGALAGPRVLEHMVDAVLYFEGQTDSRFRMIRAIKNRFGAVNELGIFAMTDTGLKEVANPSAIFLSSQSKSAPGSVILIGKEGTRPLLVEVQALVDESRAGHPRRMTLGLDATRLGMLLAVLHRHGGIAVGACDVFLNIVGGVKISETAADLATILACASSIKEKPLPKHFCSFGEVGLSGEIRPVPSGQERLKEAAKHGFRIALVPRANMPKAPVAGMRVIGIDTLSDALDFAFNIHENA